MKLTFDGFNARTVTPDEVESLQSNYGYNEDVKLNKYISVVYMERNPNFMYEIAVLTSASDFQNYYEEKFVYDFEEWSCISWFIDKENIFHAVCLEEGTFIVVQYKLTSQDNTVMQDIRSEYGQWEIKI